MALRCTPGRRSASRLYDVLYKYLYVDDVTRTFLENMEGRLAAKVDGIRHDVIVVSNKLDAFKTDVAERFAAVDRHHGEQMRRYQAVVDAAERIGASEARDARLTVLETEVAELRSQVAALLRAGGGTQ
jgi:hypothetical protein